ncbi:hypothetical protein CCR75_004095 [Bremia lactucae]|uniref:Prokaryotic-type class I peptide chain release factors domain-containing protein n=1 Tax=Bremia lactucae TaxID=4779 RepID=A0A976IJ50_BRELC|nr:hypothetical protein CCR75_004095 [Bremia lactucae]
MYSRFVSRCASSRTSPSSIFAHWTLLSDIRHSSSTAILAERRDVELKESELSESFVKGSGKGGQKINKVRNCVLLTHVPTGLQVQCQKTRSLDGNRRAARKLLQQKLDDHVNGESSKRSLKIDRLRRKKANRSAKSKKKYTNSVDMKLKEKEQAEGIASNAVTKSDEEPDSDSGNENESDDDYVDLDLEDSKVGLSWGSKRFLKR